MDESITVALRGHGVRPEYWAMLTDAPYPDGGSPLCRIIWFVRRRALWLAHRNEVLADWILRHPGTRPSSWWLFEMSVRHPGRLFEMPIMRKQVGGKGTVNAMDSWCGLPRPWSLLGYSYTERRWRSLDHGPPTQREDYMALTFESQAAFLLRNNLLLPGERERLSDIDFMPVQIPADWWPHEGA